MSSKIGRACLLGVTYIERHLSRFDWYWRIAPYYHQRIQTHDVEDYEAPCNPYKIEMVDPDSIKEITRRERPLDYHVLGEVREGEWDRSDTFQFNKSYPRVEYMQKKYPTMKIEDSVFYNSMYDRFVNNLDWVETEFVRMEVERIENGKTVWGKSNSKKELLNHAQKVDELFKEIKNNGYKSQKELKTRNALPEARRNEILVDVGRDGDLLFCDGRHRLCIAKILNLNKVPVAFGVRHSEWMEYRDEVYKKAKKYTHADLLEFK